MTNIQGLKPELTARREQIHLNLNNEKGNLDPNSKQSREKKGKLYCMGEGVLFCGKNLWWGYGVKNALEREVYQGIGGGPG